jgi:uncharacterized membrane protein YgcG
MMMMVIAVWINFNSANLDMFVIPIIFFFIYFPSLIYSISKFAIPNPMISPEKCGRENVPKSAICDLHNLLKSEDKDVIEGKINEIQDIEIALVIIQKMKKTSGDSEDSIDSLAQEYATHLHNHWGIGSAIKQNGLLLFLSIQDRAIYLSRGTGLSTQLNHIVIQLLISHMKPFLLEGQYAKAIEAVLIEIDLLLHDQPNSAVHTASVKQHYFQSIVYGFVACLFGVLVYYGYRQHQQEEEMRRGERALSRLIKEISSESENKFRFSSCPICMEEFHYSPNTSEGKQEDFRELEELPNAGRVSTHPRLLAHLTLSIPAPLESPSSPSLPSPSTDPLRPMALHCGHAFCFACLETYLKDKKNGKKCPICRSPVDPAAAAAAPPPPPPSNYPSSSHHQPYDPTDCHHTNTSSSSPHSETDTRFRYHSPELMYRMNRMRYLYPTVMTADTYERMNRGVVNQSASEVIQAVQARRDEVTRQLADITHRRAQQRSGSGGSSRSSWGGGSSGGGGGGRW